MMENQGRVFFAAKSFAMVAIACAAVAFTYQYGRSVNQSYYRSFSVTGEGMVTATPDIARFSASVVTDGGIDVAAVQQQNTEKMNKVIEFIKSQDVDAKDIKTQQYTLNPRYEYPTCVAGKPCPGPKISGYSVTQSVAVKVRKTEKAGALISGVVDNGANSVSEISFVVDDETKSKNDAREEAIEQAKKQAVSIARLSGFGLGKIISVYEDTGNGEMPPVSYGMGGGADSMKQASVAPTIEPGSTDQKVRMVLTYEIR